VIAPELFATALLREHAEIKGKATSVARLCSTARRFMEISSHHQRFGLLADGMVLGKRMTWGEGFVENSVLFSRGAEVRQVI
jgi:hypothetical protein